MAASGPDPGQSVAPEFYHTLLTENKDTQLVGAAVAQKRGQIQIIGVLVGEGGATAGEFSGLKAREQVFSQELGRALQRVDRRLDLLPAL